MSKSSKKQSNRTAKKKSSNKNQQIAIGLIVVGLVLAAVAAFLYFSGGSRGNAGTPGDVSAIPDGLAVATLVGIKNTGTQPTKGNLAPNFGFRYSDGTSYTLADFKGQPVIVNFWATWCPPCRREMPGLVTAYETYKDDGLMIIEVDVAEKPEAVAQFVKEYNMTMPVVLDQRQEVTRLYRTDSFPTSIFIDKDGIIQVRWIGYMAEDQLADNLKTILP
jgi:thiol-disulfide isomerase/thioredoxin